MVGLMLDPRPNEEAGMELENQGKSGPVDPNARKKDEQEKCRRKMVGVCLVRMLW